MRPIQPQYYNSVDTKGSTLDIQATAVPFQAETSHWYYLHGTETGSWAHSPLYSTGTYVFPLELKSVRHTANHSTLSCPKVMNEWSCMSAPPYAFMVCISTITTGYMFWHSSAIFMVLNIWAIKNKHLCIPQNVIFVLELSNLQKFHNYINRNLLWNYTI